MAPSTSIYERDLPTPGMQASIRWRDAFKTPHHVTYVVQVAAAFELAEDRDQRRRYRSGEEAQPATILKKLPDEIRCMILAEVFEDELWKDSVPTDEIINVATTCSSFYGIMNDIVKKRWVADESSECCIFGTALKDVLPDLDTKDNPDHGIVSECKRRLRREKAIRRAEKARIRRQKRASEAQRIVDEHNALESIIRRLRRREKWNKDIALSTNEVSIRAGS